MKCVDDFRLRLGKRELVPIMIGGMGVDISTAELALEAARLGGVGHISDAMLPTVTDRRYKTKFVSEKQKQYKLNIPLVGVAKGYDRKQDRFVYDEKNIKLADFIANNKNLLLKVRDEAHRFAVGYHKFLRKKSLLK